MADGWGEYDRWTQDEDEKLKALWAEGITTSEIGRALKRTKNMVIGRVRRLKLPRRPSPVTLSNPWTNEALEQLKVLRSKGYSAGQIAAQLGRPIRGVNLKIQRLELPLAPASLRAEVQKPVTERNVARANAGRRAARDKLRPMPRPQRCIAPAPAPRAPSDAVALNYDEIADIAKRYRCWRPTQDFLLSEVNAKLIADGYRPVRIRPWQPGARELPARDLRA